MRPRTLGLFWCISYLENNKSDHTMAAAMTLYRVTPRYLAGTGPTPQLRRKKAEKEIVFGQAQNTTHKK
jgi:hypothetical protein